MVKVNYVNNARCKIATCILKQIDYILFSCKFVI